MPVRLFMANIQFYQLLRLKLQYFYKTFDLFTFTNQIKERLNICISLMWTLLSDWHIRFAEGCLWYLKYSLFWCLVGEFPSLNVTLLNICPSLPWQAQGYSRSFFIWTIFFTYFRLLPNICMFHIFWVRKSKSQNI